MLPRLFQNHATNTMLAHAVFISQLILGQTGGSYVSNVLFAQFRVIMIFASFVVGSVASFAHHIFDVLSMGAHGKMLWVYTRRVIAGVHDFHALLDPFFVLKHPRNSVSHVHFAPVRNAKEALALFIFGRQPRPTFVGRSFFYFVPKSDLKFFIKHGQYVHFDEGNIKF